MCVKLVELRAYWIYLHIIITSEIISISVNISRLNVFVNHGIHIGSAVAFIANRREKGTTSQQMHT